MLIFMFQKELADRIVADVNNSNYGRLSILCKWKFNTKKVFEISPNSFYPKPKIKSTLLIFTPRTNIVKFKNHNSLEKITRIFFNQRRKKLKKPFNLLFKDNTNILNNLKIDLNLRPQNLNHDIYYELTKEYEKL